MCVIVDNNQCHKLWNRHADVVTLVNALEARRTVLVFGGKLTREYLESGSMRRYLARLGQMGAARRIADDDIRREEESMAGSCVSDDAHVIALARVGKVRLLCTQDADLIADFKNRDLIDDPPGSIYALGNRKANDRLIRKHCQCHASETTR
ncbi:hypothetical protein HS125_20055 [bacterium]|nr:hypothetical protein [bacterium]